MDRVQKYAALMHKALEGVLTFCQFTENNCRKISIANLDERVNEEVQRSSVTSGLALALVDHSVRGSSTQAD